jgi:hypothetical protein
MHEGKRTLPKLVEPSVEKPDPSPQGPFDLARLRLSQNFHEMIGGKKLITTVPVRSPDKQWFIRVHPDEAWRLPTAVIELKEDREVYLVERSLWEELPSLVTPRMLFTAANRQGVVFLWPVRLPASDGRQDNWSRSALQAAEFAMRSWIRVVANLHLGAYEVYEAGGNLPEPEWPEITFTKLLEIAFGNRFIQSPDHPLMRRLRGEI